MAYLAGGRFLPDASADVLRVPDEPGRLAEYQQQSLRLEGVFVVPRPTFEWLVRQAAELRRLREEMLDNDPPPG